MPHASLYGPWAAWKCPRGKKWPCSRGMGHINTPFQLKKAVLPEILPHFGWWLARIFWNKLQERASFGWNGFFGQKIASSVLVLIRFWPELFFAEFWFWPKLRNQFRSHTTQERAAADQVPGVRGPRHEPEPGAQFNRTYWWFPYQVKCE